MIDDDGSKEGGIVLEERRSFLILSVEGTTKHYMNDDEELKLERYKVITERQKYFTELAKDTFNIYLKIFVYIVTLPQTIAGIAAKST